MKRLHKIKFFIVISLFITAASFSLFYKVERIAQTMEIDLTAIPAEVGEWRLLDEQTDLSTFEATFLNNVLLRRYQRHDGMIVMLAVAYGADQRQNFSIHVPEGCYRASGFDVASYGLVNMTDIPNLVMKRMVAKNRQRTEPIQYWIVLDGKIVTNHFERKARQIYYSLFGVQSEGVLFRVSSLSTDRDVQQHYEIQKAFIAAVYKTLNPQLKEVFFGKEKLALSS